MFNKNISKKLDYISIADIDVGIYHKGPVGIHASGGADSSILLYILMNTVSQPIHIYSLINQVIRPRMEPALDRVVEICADLTGNQNYFIHKHIVPMDDVEDHHRIMNTALDSKEVDIIYSGMTAFPPADICNSFKIKNPDWLINARSSEKNRPLFGFKMPPHRTKLDQRFYMPFRNHNKKHIASIYRELGVEHKIYPHTCSCENYEILDKQCGECWWCEERVWGFGYLE